MIVWMLVPFWSAPIETVLTELAARPDGLTQIEAERQQLRFGPNRRSDTRKTTPLGLLLNQFRSPLVLLLLFAMALSLFLGETTDGLIVLAIVLGSALLGFLQEYRASSAVAKLLAVIQTKVTVLRDGHEVQLPHDALVRGDVIVLAAGETILDQFGFDVADMGGVEGARAIEPLCILWCIPGFLSNSWTHAFRLLKK
jgi:P-type Mg2+ transporter